jgi:hypothetical protein
LARIVAYSVRFAFLAKSFRRASTSLFGRFHCLIMSYHKSLDL